MSGVCCQRDAVCVPDVGGVVVCCHLLCIVAVRLAAALRVCAAHPTHGFETLLSPQPGDSSPDGQSDGPADHPYPLPDDSSPHGHVFFPDVRTPVT